MSSQGQSLAARRKKKQLTILAVMVGVTGITWSRTLFGGSDGPAPTPVATPPGVAVGAAAGAPAASGPVVLTSAGTIGSFEQAMARMKVWPKALDRKSHTGPIEEILPFEDLSIEKPEEKAPLAAGPSFPPLGPTPLLETTPPEQPKQPEIDFEDLNLELTTTAIMGKNRYAVIEGQRLTVGDTFEFQVAGQTFRYEVSAILPRSVELRAGETKYVLRIASPGFETKGNDGA